MFRANPSELLVERLGRFIVRTWNPQSFKTESKYRDDLLAFLNEYIERSTYRSYQDARIISAVKESREGCDIKVTIEYKQFFAPIKSDICVELKYNLKSRSSLDRLVGQLTRYSKKYHGVLLVFVGSETREDLINDLLYNRIREIKLNIPVKYVIIKRRRRHNMGLW